MNLSASNKEILVKEIRTAADYMKKATTIQEKLFFFSAVFGIANRLMNLEFDPELGFLHHVTQAAFNTINPSLLMATQGQSPVTFPPSVFDKLQEALNDLAICIEDGKPVYKQLQRISNLAYSTSGNGYYLFLKGALKVE